MVEIFSVRFGSDVWIDVKVSVITISASLTAYSGSVVKSIVVFSEAFFTTSGFGSKPFGVAITISVCVLPQPKINELHTLFPSPIQAI